MTDFSERLLAPSIILSVPVKLSGVQKSELFDDKGGVLRFHVMCDRQVTMLYSAGLFLITFLAPEKSNKNNNNCNGCSLN